MLQRPFQWRQALSAGDDAMREPRGKTDVEQQQRAHQADDQAARGGPVVRRAHDWMEPLVSLDDRGKIFFVDARLSMHGSLSLSLKVYMALIIYIYG